MAPGVAVSNVTHIRRIWGYHRMESPPRAIVITICGAPPTETISFEHFTLAESHPVIAGHIASLPAPLCDICHVGALKELETGAIAAQSADR